MEGRRPGCNARSYVRRNKACHLQASVAASGLFGKLLNEVVIASVSIPLVHVLFMPGLLLSAACDVGPAMWIMLKLVLNLQQSFPQNNVTSPQLAIVSAIYPLVCHRSFEIACKSSCGVYAKCM